jgi:hypothetical protein
VVDLERQGAFARTHCAERETKNTHAQATVAATSLDLKSSERAVSWEGNELGDH